MKKIICITVNNDYKIYVPVDEEEMIKWIKSNPLLKECYLVEKQIK